MDGVDGQGPAGSQPGEGRGDEVTGRGEDHGSIEWDGRRCVDRSRPVSPQLEGQATPAFAGRQKTATVHPHEQAIWSAR